MVPSAYSVLACCRVLGAGAFALLLSGCGGMLYAVRAGAVSSELELAGRAGAAETAPYEYYSAEEHLRKARSEAAESDYGDALSLLDEAEDYARHARDRVPAPMNHRLTISAPAPSRRVPSEIARLDRIARDAEQSGARQCAPRELAVGRSQLEFAAIEDGQGFGSKANEHLRIAEQNVQAARLLSARPHCAGGRAP